MKKILSIVILLISLTGYGQRVPASRVSGLPPVIRTTPVGSTTLPVSNAGILASDSLPVALGKAQGQVNFLASQITTTVSAPMLDSYSNLSVAFGTVRLKTGATRAFRLRRASDNVQSDFYFNVGGTLEYQDILNFLGGARGYVTTWYDQSGNNNHAVQATAANQPYLVIEDGQVRVRFEANAGLNQSLAYTLASAVDVRNTTVFSVLRNYVASATNFAASFTKRQIFGSANVKLDLYADAAGPDFDALRLASNTVQSTVNLFGYASPNYVAVRSNATNVRVTSAYKTSDLSALTSASETGFTIGNAAAGGNPFSGDFYTFVQFSSSLTDAQVSTLGDAAKPVFDLIDNAASNLNIVVEGNSISNGIGATNNQNYPAQMLTTRRNLLVDVAIEGNQIINLTTKSVHVDRNLLAGKTNVLLLWIGTNDLNAGASATTVYNNLLTYVQARRAAGWNKIYVFTTIQRGFPAGIETQRVAYNTSLRGNTTDWDGLIDVDADARLRWVTGASSIADYDRQYYSDGIHLSNEGYKVVASLVDARLEELSSTFSANQGLSGRLSSVENQLATLSGRVILNQTGTQISSNLNVDGTIYTPRLQATARPNGTLSIQASNTTGTGNQGRTFIEPAGGYFTVGRATANTPLSFDISSNTLTSPNINWITRAGQAIQHMYGTSEQTSTLYAGLAGFQFDPSNNNTSHWTTGNFLIRGGGGFQFQRNASGTVAMQALSTGEIGLGTTAVANSAAFTLSGTVGGAAATAWTVFNSTQTWNSGTGFVSALSATGHRLNSVLSGTATSTASVSLLGNDFTTSFSPAAAFSATNAIGARVNNLFAHTTGAYTLTGNYTGFDVSTTSNSTQNASVSTLYGLRVRPSVKGSTGNLTGTNGYGLRLEAFPTLTDFTNQWNLYVAGGGDNYLGGRLAIGTAADVHPAASAVVELSSTTQGFLPPRMTTAQRTAIASPAEGLCVYDTDIKKLFVFDGTTWQAAW